MEDDMIKKMIEGERERYIRLISIQSKAFISESGEDLRNEFYKELLEGYIINRVLVERLYKKIKEIEEEGGE